MASERITTETVSKAIDSLLQWRKSKLETEKPKLFYQDEESVFLVLTLKKVPQNGRVNPHKIPIPHSLLSQSSEQCLIIDDRPKTARITKDEVENQIQSESIPISSVIKLSELASDYRPFEAKRKLCDSYDLFFADKTLIPLLPRLLGKQFFKKRKLPVPIDFKKKVNLKEVVEKACASAMFFMRTGTCSVVKVGKLSMERDEIVENVVAAISGVVEIVPKKWEGVRAFHVKLLDSVSLPVYQVVPDLRLKIEGVKDGEEDVVEKVRDGKAVKKKKKGRIHEIKYMDDKMSEDGDEHGDDIDDGGEDGEDRGGDDSENGERINGGLVSKKRKKGTKAKKGASGELGSESKDSAKRKKKDGSSEKGANKGLIQKAENKLLVEVEGSSKKKTNRASSELGSELKDSAKRKKKDGSSVKAAKEDLMKSENNLLVEDEGSGKKKTRGDSKVKTKKSKKAA